jgi:hypothetical protein
MRAEAMPGLPLPGEGWMIAKCTIQAFQGLQNARKNPVAAAAREL